MRKVIVDLDDAELYFQGNSQPMKNNMYMGVWLYRVKGYLQDCPEYIEPATFENWLSRYNFFKRFFKWIKRKIQITITINP